MVKHNQKIFAQESGNEITNFIETVLRAVKDPVLKRAFLYHLSGFIVIKLAELDNLQDIMSNMLDASWHVESQLNKGKNNG